MPYTHPNLFWSKTLKEFKIKNKKHQSKLQQKQLQKKVHHEYNKMEAMNFNLLKRKN